MVAAQAVVPSIKVFLGSERATPDGWVRAYWPQGVIRLLETGRVAEISLNHDLGDDDRGTGHDVLLWIEEAVVSRGFQPPKMAVHTANLAARGRMERAVAAIGRAAACR